MRASCGSILPGIENFEHWGMKRGLSAQETESKLTVMATPSMTLLIEVI